MERAIVQKSRIARFLALADEKNASSENIRNWRYILGFTDYLPFLRLRFCHSRGGMPNTLWKAREKCS